MGASAAVKGRRPGCGVGTEQEGGSQDAELARRGCRAQSGRPGRGGPLISAIPPPGGLPLRFPSREKAPLLLRHDL